MALLSLLFLCLSFGRIEALLTTSRLPASRIVAAHCARNPLYMCDGAMEEAVAAPEAEAPEGIEQKQRRRAPREPRTPVEDLELGSTVEGTVRSVQSYGAFVNIGATTDGLLHVSEMADTFVKDATEMFKVGDKVSVRIKSVNTEKQQVALSCKSESAVTTPRRARGGKADMSEYESADPKVFVSGKVSSITSFGAFVTLKEGVDGLIHISAISEQRCESVEDVLSVGQEVQVRVISFDPSKRRLGLSMREYVEPSADSESDDKPRGRGRGGGRGGGSDDAEFKLSDDELAEMGVDFEGEEDDTSVFAQAFARAELIQAAKAQKKRYEPLLL